MRKGIDGMAALIQHSFRLTGSYSDSKFLFAGWKKDRYKSRLCSARLKTGQIYKKFLKVTFTLCLRC